MLIQFFCLESIHPVAGSARQSSHSHCILVFPFNHTCVFNIQWYSCVVASPTRHRHQGEGDNGSTITSSQGAVADPTERRETNESTDGDTQQRSSSHPPGAAARSQGLQDKLARLSAMRRSRMTRAAAGSSSSSSTAGTQSTTAEGGENDKAHLIEAVEARAALAAARDEITRLQKALARAREDRDLADARALARESADGDEQRVSDRGSTTFATPRDTPPMTTTTDIPEDTAEVMVGQGQNTATEKEERYVSNFAEEDANEDEKGEQYRAGRKSSSEAMQGPFDGLLHDESLVAFLLSLYESGADLTQIVETQRVQEETISEYVRRSLACVLFYVFPLSLNSNVVPIIITNSCCRKRYIESYNSVDKFL